MKRMKFLFGQRRMQVLLTLAVLLLAASVVIGSGANFTSTSANPGNVFTAGNLSHTNDALALLDLTDVKLKPDDTWVSVGSVTLTNDGDFDGAFTLATSDLGDTPGAGHSAYLSTVLQLRVMRGAAVVYNGPIDGVGTSDAGTILAGAPATYKFAVMFPDTGAPGGANLGDNRFKGASLTIDFDWEAVNL